MPILISAYMESMATVAEALRDARKAMALSQHDLGVMLGCTQGFIAQIEAGTRPLPLPMIAAVPSTLRGAIIDAKLAELQDQADKLEAMR